MDREFDIVPLEQARGKEFGYDLTTHEFRSLLGTDADWPKIIYGRGSQRDSNGVLDIYIRRGATIDDTVVQAFQKKKIRYIPVLEDVHTREPRQRLSQFTKEHALILAGKVHSGVQEWLTQSGKGLERGIDRYVLEQRGDLQKSLVPHVHDLGHMVTHIFREMLSVNSYLVTAALYKEFIDDIHKYAVEGEAKPHEDSLNHVLAVTAFAILLGKQIGLDDPRLKELAFSALIHDMGVPLGYEKAREAMIERKVEIPDFDKGIQRYFRLHPTYGALLLTRKDGSAIEGLEPSVRFNVLQHHQHVDGTGDDVYLSTVGKLLEKMGVQVPIRYHGFNQLPSTPYGEMQYKLVGEIGPGSRAMTMEAQVLAIVEHYLTQTSGMDRRRILEGMIDAAGSRFNRPVFEAFLNTMVPLEDYPSGIKLVLKPKRGGPFEKYNNCTVAIISGGGNPSFFLYEDAAGNSITPKPIDLLAHPGMARLTVGR